MKNGKIKEMSEGFIPTVLFSGITGCLAGIAVYGFKRLAALLTSQTDLIYTLVGENLWAIPLLFLGLLALSAVAYLILKYCKTAMGSGLPSSVAALRGILTLKPLKTLIATALSALITFFAGIPLGNEGPSVQMGTAIGDAIGSRLNKDMEWKKYIMTSGASAGFAAATGAPLSGVLLSLEEAHERFSPMLLLSTLSGVVGAATANSLLTRIFGGATAFIHLESVGALSLKYLPLAAIIGITSGIIAVIYSNIYKLFRKITKKIPLFIRLAAVFLLTGIMGLVCFDALGSGHHLIEELLSGSVLPFAIIIILLFKIGFTSLASATGITGGLFIPTLTIGALLGSLEAWILGMLGFDQSIFVAVILISMAAFLGASMKTPFLAIVFSIEVLFCGENILFVTAAVLLGYLTVKLAENKSICEISLQELTNKVEIK